jgi:hypothetical protein
VVRIHSGAFRKAKPHRDPWTRSIASGGAWGYLIDGTAASTRIAVFIDAAAAPNGVISITRIR